MYQKKRKEFNLDPIVLNINPDSVVFTTLCHDVVKQKVNIMSV